MDPELYELLKENNQLLKESVDLGKENNKKIRKIHASLRRSSTLRSIYWIIIIIITIGSYVALKPYVQNLYDQYNSVVDQLNKTNDVIQDPRSLINEDSFIHSLFNTEEE